ncbi:uncharacterized protein BDW70DRAFT_171360 [Aspergillus foveolatus]|uniref:uncharacterized protein n=1 Tax=Aspergillus foveolatus TaxID=210207 RepID=UPI003CCE26A9
MLSTSDAQTVFVNSLDGQTRQNMMRSWHPLHTSEYVWTKAAFAKSLLRYLGDNYANSLPPALKLKCDYAAGKFREKHVLREAGKPFGTMHTKLKELVTKENVEMLGFVDWRYLLAFRAAITVAQYITPVLPRGQAISPCVIKMKIGTWRNSTANSANSPTETGSDSSSSGPTGTVDRDPLERATSQPSYSISPSCVSACFNLDRTPERLVISVLPGVAPLKAANPSPSHSTDKLEYTTSLPFFNFHNKTGQVTHPPASAVTMRYTIPSASPRTSSSAALALLSLLASTTAQSTVGFGPAFSLGPTQSWIREANTTLILPKTPGLKDRLALWPGMGTSGGDLIQALAVSFSDPNANCGASEGQWCTWASTLQGEQLGGTEVPANEGDKLTMHYVYNDSTGEYDQTVYINGESVSTLSTSSGQAQGWGTAVECQDDACESTTVAAHQYLDTTIILDSEDTTFKDTLVLTEADSTEFSSSDGGKTWTVETINIHEHTYNL